MLFADHYRLVSKLGEGGFGAVFSASEGDNTDPTVALKIERIRKFDDARLLDTEKAVYDALSGTSHIPRIIECGETDTSRFIAMELLGRTLDDLHYFCQDHFTLKTVLMIIEQTLSAMESLHQCGFVYRDVKPSNFMIGRGERAPTIFMVDYGLCRRYLDENGNHIPFADDSWIAGTSRYCTARAMIGHELSRRDDMESLGFMWISFMKPLPWCNVPCDMSNSERRKQVLQLKNETSVDELCAELPKEFHRYMTRVRALAFDEEPPYAEFREMFRKLFVRFRFVYDYQFDWVGNPRLEGKPKPKPKPRVRAVERPMTPERIKEKMGVPERLCPLNTGERLLSKIRESHVDMKPSEVYENVAEARRKRLRRGTSTASCAAIPTLAKISEKRLPVRHGTLKPSSSTPGNLVMKNFGKGLTQMSSGDRSPLCSVDDLLGLDRGMSGLPVLEDSPIAQVQKEEEPMEKTKLPSIERGKGKD